MGSIILLVNALIELLTFALLVRAFISFLPLSPHNPFVRLIYQVTEPILAPLRRYIRPVGMMDFTPVVAMLLLEVVRRVLISLLYTL